MELDPSSLGAVKCISLTEIYGAPFTHRRNRWGFAPVSDFGLTLPFRLLTLRSAARLRRICDQHVDDRRCSFSTARTSHCLRGCAELEALVSAAGDQLTRLASSLAGQPLRLHTMALERAHVNVQRKAQSQPVDNWHEDSMPFVLVTLLTNHEDDPGGALLVQRDDGNAASRDHGDHGDHGDLSKLGDLGGNHQNENVFTCKLRLPGEAVLMQGSQLRHCAQQSQTGARLTMVTCFVPATGRYVDSSSIRIAVLYSPPGEAARQFGAHVCERTARNARKILSILGARDSGQQRQENRREERDAGDADRDVADVDDDGDVEQRLRVLVTELRAVTKEAAEAANALPLCLNAADTPEQGRVAANAAVRDLELVANSFLDAVPALVGALESGGAASCSGVISRALERIIRIAESRSPVFRCRSSAVACSRL